jgi:hypothetical protein
MAHFGLSTLKLILQFWYFEVGKDFALAYTVTDIYLDPADVPGDLGVKIDFLVRLKLACNSEGAG